jgi:hypothetical protein
MNENFKKATSSLPLMLNFVQSKKMEIVTEKEISMMYDPVTQITVYMGGGSSKSSKSQTSTKETVTSYIGGKPDKSKLDHSYGSDD